MAAADFPRASKVSPIYEIGGELFHKVTTSEGQKNARAVRGSVLNSNDELEIKWFVPLAAGRPLVAPGDAPAPAEDDVIDPEFEVKK